MQRIPPHTTIIRSTIRITSGAKRLCIFIPPEISGSILSYETYSRVALFTILEWPGDQWSIPAGKGAGRNPAPCLFSSVAFMRCQRRFGVKSLIPLRAVRYGKSEISERFARSVNGYAAAARVVIRFRNLLALISALTSQPSESSSNSSARPLMWLINAAASATVRRQYPALFLHGDREPHGWCFWREP
jgi:hypothetical protein